jgi:hypothetical protein
MFVVFYTVYLRARACVYDFFQIQLCSWHTYGSKEYMCIRMYVYMYVCIRSFSY